METIHPQRCRPGVPRSFPPLPFPPVRLTREQMDAAIGRVQEMRARGELPLTETAGKFPGRSVTQVTRCVPIRLAAVAS